MTQSCLHKLPCCVLTPARVDRDDASEINKTENQEIPRHIHISVKRSDLGHLDVFEMQGAGGGQTLASLIGQT